MESKLTPILRFREYEHEWKAKTFKELGSVAMCKRIFKEQTTAQGEIPFYKIGTFGKIADSYISRETYEEYKEKYIYPKVGDILLSASGTIGRTVIYDGEDAYFQDSNIIWFNAHKEPLDNSFLYQFYQVVKWSGLEGSTIKRLYNENVLSTNINLPSLEEQKKIGSFFKSLDDTISLHQQELEALKQTKQGFLQKMFPKKGESLPQLRFKEFDRPWSDCKLKNLGEIKTGATPSTGDIDNYSEEGMLWITPTDIKGMVTKNSAKKLSLKGQEKARIVEPYSILVTSIASIGKNTMVEGYASFNQQINSLTPFKSNDSYFLLTQSYFWSKEMKNKAASGTMQIVNKSEFSEMSFLVPEKKEQVKIGEFFKQLDEVIELKEKELKALKETKKGFLQKMFV